MSGPFPDLPAFEEFLRSLTFNPPPSDRYDSIPIYLRPARNVDGTIIEPGILNLWFSSECKVTPASVRRKLGEVLCAIHHLSDGPICDALLALLSVVPSKKGTSAIDRLNLLLNHVVSADLSQYFAFLVHGSLTIRYEVGGFHVGPLNLEQLSYRCQKADSDYARIHGRRLRGLPLSIQRQNKVNVLGMESYIEGWNSVWSPSSIEYALVDLYYHSIADACYDHFFDDFRQAQLLPQALGASWLSVDLLQRLAGSERVSIFLNIKGQRSGWVAPTTLTMNVDLGGPHVGVPLVVNTLADRFGALGEGPVDAVIRTFCRFLAEAADLEAQKRKADAFLYHVIALDLLLGEKDSSTASVTKRSALLAHTGLNVENADLIKRCDRIYDARSKYVHGGVTPDPGLLPEVEEISREIAIALFRLRQTGVNDDADFRKSWVKRIDVLIAKLAAGDLLTEDELRRVGAACQGDFNYLQLLNVLKA